MVKDFDCLTSFFESEDFSAECEEVVDNNLFKHFYYKLIKSKYPSRYYSKFGYLLMCGWPQKYTVYQNGWGHHNNIKNINKKKFKFILFELKVIFILLQYCSIFQL
jgi:hypothetical protein